ncbi:hypothetical protein JHK87_039120 [Glycine soja]|nr:hypothetical protein JHK87_039120 [Glycine soja]
MSCPASAGCGDVRVHAEEVIQSEEVTKNFDIGRPAIKASELHSQQRDCSHSGRCDAIAGDVVNTPKF